VTTQQPAYPPGRSPFNREAERPLVERMVRAEALRDMITSVRADGVEFAVACAHQAVLDSLERSGCLDLIGDEHVAPPSRLRCR
jgi:hypothetical protein